jgi:hypothetical protein
MAATALEHDLLRLSMFGTDAVYRVRSAEGETVTVEVVDAPGLPRGTRVRLTAAAARAMEDPDPAEARRTVRTHRRGRRVGHPWVARSSRARVRPL